MMRGSRDGRRKRGRATGSLTRKGESYELRTDGRTVLLFDPAKSLRVGRLWNRFGIIYDVSLEREEMRKLGRPERGFVPWNGRDRDELIISALKIAMRLGGMSVPPRRLMEQVAKSWGSKDIWSRLAEDHEIGSIMTEVMEI